MLVTIEITKIIIIFFGFLQNQLSLTVLVHYRLSRNLLDIVSVITIFK